MNHSESGQEWEALQAELKRILEDENAKDLVRLLLTTNSNVLHLLAKLFELEAETRKSGDFDLVGLLERLLEFAEKSQRLNEQLALLHQDIRMLEGRHFEGGLNMRDVTLLQCRDILGREAFLKLYETDALSWLDDLPFSALLHGGAYPTEGGRPLSPLTLSAYVKLCLLIPPERVVKDEVEDVLKQYERRSSFEKQRIREQAVRTAVKRVERLLKRLGLPGRKRWDNLSFLVSLEGFDD